MTHTDMSRAGLIGRLPPRMQDMALLMRLDRPAGTWLLLLPACWAIALAAPARLDLYLTFAIGAIVMRAAGCVINDLWDRDLDAAVERTRARPLVTGAVRPRAALALLAGLLLTGLAILLTLPPLAVKLGVLSMGPVIVYPLMKRITWWPQLFLGITFNAGALIGWAAATGALPVAAFFLYAAGVAWTLGYDTIYAHQDKIDDALVGIRSTARLFADKSKYWVAGFYALCVLFLLLAAPTPLMALPAAHFAWQVYSWNMNDPASALRIFKSARDAGLLVFAALLIFAW